MLVELVANAGKVVTREELQQRLWPADTTSKPFPSAATETFVDFSVGVNTAIRKIRLALTSSPK